MRENITFRKIRDKNGKVLAALNLNNMIPIRNEYITEIEMNYIISIYLISHLKRERFALISQL